MYVQRTKETTTKEVKEGIIAMFYQIEHISRDRYDQKPKRGSGIPKVQYLKWKNHYKDSTDCIKKTLANLKLEWHIIQNKKTEDKKWRQMNKASEKCRTPISTTYT